MSHGLLHSVRGASEGGRNVPATGQSPGPAGVCHGLWLLSRCIASKACYIMVNGQTAMLHLLNAILEHYAVLMLAQSVFVAVQSLGISRELREAGYALMCVGYPRSDLVLETVPEDEVYDMQFGKHFAEMATNPHNVDYVERDDFAVEIANMDE